MIVSFLRVIKFAFQNFWRNFWLSLITITILVLTLISINILVVLSFLAQTAVDTVEQKVDVSVYFKSEVSEDAVKDVRSYLLGLSQVKDVKYVGREEALEEFESLHEDNEEIMASLGELGENPLGATLIIKAHSSADYPFILETLDNPQFTKFIEDKNYDDHEEVIGRINDISSRVQNFGIILSAVFVTIAVLIVINTIRVAIYTHREEIGIMKLVGASNWFVRAPFLVEGIFYAFLATFVLGALIYPTIILAEPYVNAFFDGQNVGLVDYFNNNLAFIFGTEFLALAFLNIVSASFALGRYLKV
ncbi:ABC transporter permease [Patescibacteria group bacterium]|nr:ABC transporter permease [Patescibacteria group bacterium]MBU1921736.1 ABC transporter permease [Patescibacteria group bacterium]